MSSTDSDRFDIFFAGECLEGHDPQAVREAVGRLFKADETTLERLFSGRRQRIKRDCDRATALKYQKAVTAAGGRVIVTRAGATDGTDKSDDKSEGKTEESAAAAAAAPTLESAGPDDLTVAPSGSDVLTPDERRTVAAPAMDLSHLSVADSGERLAPEQGPADPAVAAPDYAVAEVGAELGPGPAPPPAETPDTSNISLAPEGGDLSDCAPPPAEPVEVDLTQFDLADAGSDLLLESERARTEGSVPDISHLSLELDSDFLNSG